MDVVRHDQSVKALAARPNLPGPCFEEQIIVAFETHPSLEDGFESVVLPVQAVNNNSTGLIIVLNTNVELGKDSQVKNEGHSAHRVLKSSGLERYKDDERKNEIPRTGGRC